MFNHIESTIKYEDLKTSQQRGMRFYKTPSGVLLPSITTILGSQEKPWLDNWKQSLGPSKAKKEQNRCADRGEAVHLLAERFLKNEDLSSELNTIPAEYTRLFNQLRKTLTKKVDNVRAQEVALWDEELGTAGRVDLVADYERVVSIIDFKTSTGIKQESQIEDYFTQSTAYALMYEKLYGIRIDQIVIIIATEKGFMPLVFKKCVDDYIHILTQRISEFYNKEHKLISHINRDVI